MHISSHNRLFASTASLALFASPVFADVTAQDVWDNWRVAMQEYGYAVSATEEVSGNELRVNELLLNMEMPEEEGTVSVSMEQLTFTENGDGTVGIALPKLIPITFDIEDEIEAVTATVLMSNSSMTTVASGSPDDITYTYEAASIAMMLDSLVVDGETISDLDVNGEILGVAGTSQIASGEMLTSANNMSADSLTFMIKGKDPSSTDMIDISMSLADLQASSDMMLPPGSFASNDPADMFAEGLNLEGSFSMKTMALAGAFEDSEGPGQINMTTGAGGVDLKMTDALISYGGKITEVAASVLAPDVPLPIDVTFGELGYDLAFPLKASEEEQSFQFGLNFTEIGLSDFIWGMFDPGNILPRDPATLVLGLSGKATVLQDIMSLGEDVNEAPGELNALSLDTLEFKAAGADITGSGDFTFDNSDMTSFDGFPRPEGVLDVKLNGINGLMDKLITMGLLPEDQAMPVRMMMGMFTVSEGDDQLSSRIEVNEQGHVLANGQRLK